MIDLKEAGADFALTNLDLAFVSGTDTVVQRITQKFRLWRGEWFLDTSAGVPWLRDVMGQRPRDAVVNAILRRTVTDDPDVAELLSAEAQFDGQGRELTIRFRARLVDGEVINGEVMV